VTITLNMKMRMVCLCFTAGRIGKERAWPRILCLGSDAAYPSEVLPRRGKTNVPARNKGKTANFTNSRTVHFQKKLSLIPSIMSTTEALKVYFGSDKVPVIIMTPILEAFPNIAVVTSFIAPVNGTASNTSTLSLA